MISIRRYGLHVLMVCGALAVPCMASGMQLPEQSERYQVTHYGLDDGLPTETVTDITYGLDGYLYLASVNGLVRMNGHQVEVFSAGNQSGFRSDRISSINVMDQRNLLIKDHHDFVYRFRDGNATLLQNPETGNPINTPVIKKLEQDRYLLVDDSHLYIVDAQSVRIWGPSLSSFPLWDGILYRGTAYILNTDGFYRNTREGYQKVPIPGEFRPDLTYFSRILKIGEHLRIVGRGKSACYNPADGTWCPRHGIRLDNEREEIMHIRELDPGTYLIAGTQGFYRQRDGRLSPAYSSGGALMYESVFQSEMGEVLAAYDGLWIDGRKVFSPSSNIIDAAMDNRGGIWISTALEGVYNIRENPFTLYAPEAVVNSYATAKDAEGNYWGGSFEYGLMMWNPSEQRRYTQQNQTLPNNTVRMLAPLRNGGVLVSTWGEPPLVIQDENISQLTDFWPLFGPRTNVTEAFYEDSSGRWWLGTVDGLFLKSGNRYVTYYDNAGKTLSQVTRIVPSPFNSDLLFCTSTEGLVLLRNNRFHFLSRLLPPSSRHIRDAYVASEDTVWTASYNNGLQRYVLGQDPSDAQVVELDAAMGLKDAGYHRIIPDSAGYFWISTNSGLLQVSERGLNESARRGYLATNLQWYTNRDGLLNSEFNGGTQSSGYRDPETGRIWLTSMAGLVNFDPKDFNRNALNEENLHIRYLQTDRRRYHPAEKNSIELHRTERKITLSYAHISLYDNQTGHIWYTTSEEREWEKPPEPGNLRLEGLAKGTTSILFSTSPGGPVISRLDLRVAPYFYERTAFHLFILLGLAVSGLLIYRRWPSIKDFRGQGDEAPVSGRSENASAPAVSPEKWRPDAPIRQYIESQYTDSNLTVGMIAEGLSLSKSSLYRAWNEHNEQSILEYITELRLDHARRLILEKNYSITEAAYRSGFNSQSYFSKVFRKEMGIAPSDLQADSG